MFVLVLLLLAGSSQGGLPASSPPYCTWLAKASIDSNPSASCLGQCYTLCQTSPGQYFCTGQTIFTDTPTKHYNSIISGSYTYCLCTRSIIQRAPGVICGPQNQPCPMAAANNWTLATPATAASLPSGVWVDGVNNLIPNCQGQRTLTAKANATVMDTDVNCDNTLYSTLAYNLRTANGN